MSASAPCRSPRAARLTRVLLLLLAIGLVAAAAVITGNTAQPGPFFWGLLLLVLGGPWLVLAVVGKPAAGSEAAADIVLIGLNPLCAWWYSGLSWPVIV